MKRLQPTEAASNAIRKGRISRHAFGIFLNPVPIVQDLPGKETVMPDKGEFPDILAPGDKRTT